MGCAVRDLALGLEVIVGTACRSGNFFVLLRGRKITKIQQLRGGNKKRVQVMGVSQQTISNPENSEAIDDSRLKSVAAAFGIDDFSEEGRYLITLTTFIIRKSSDSRRGFPNQ